MVHFSVQPVGNALIAQFTRSQDRGLGYGISFFLSFGVGSFAAGIGGYIAENYGVANIFPVMALVLLPAVGLAYILHRKT
jgi:predicted MFS family arabinose efflux permease